MFYYELHAHTEIASLCSIVEPEAYIKYYMERGYSGMVITDHFYYGNTSIDRSLPWAEFIDAYCEGYFRARAEGDKHGFAVFFGFEQKFFDGHDEYLVLGITPNWLREHPEIRDMPRLEFFDAIHAAGGYIIQAHPYRVYSFIKEIRLSLNHVDAVEVVNRAHKDEYSRQAYEYAKNIGAIMTGGSDIHSLRKTDELSGVALERRVDTVEELIEEIREGRAVPAPTGYFEMLKALSLNSELTLDTYELTDSGFVLTPHHFAEDKKSSQ